jgi:hypothetical protein
MLPSGSAIRVAVAGPGALRSSVWRIWGSSNSDDVYLAPRSAVSQLKVSLHQSGDWQQSLTGEAAMKYVEKNQDRHLEQWKRPEPEEESLTRGYFILVPRTELRDHDEGSDGVRFAPDAGPNGWVCIEIYLISAGKEVQLHSENGLVELGRIALPGGGFAWIVASPIRPVVDIATSMRKQREAIIKAISEGDSYVGRIVNDEPGLPTIALHWTRADGIHGAIEMAFSEPPQEVRIICCSNDHDVATVSRPSFLRDSF